MVVIKIKVPFSNNKFFKKTSLFKGKYLVNNSIKRSKDKMNDDVKETLHCVHLRVFLTQVLQSWDSKVKYGEMQWRPSTFLTFLTNL